MMMEGKTMTTAIVAKYHIVGVGPFGVAEKKGGMVYDLLDTRQEALDIWKVLEDGIGPEWEAVEAALMKLFPARYPQPTVPASTSHWCPKGSHAYRCSHKADQVCAFGPRSELNCPDHKGIKRHRTKKL